MKCNLALQLSCIFSIEFIADTTSDQKAMKIILSIFFLISIFACQNEPQKLDIGQTLQKDIFTLEKDLAAFKKLSDTIPDEVMLQESFLKCRKSFKQIEWAIAYFNPNAHRFINGPPLDELETAENKFLPPNGFQVVEPLIFPSFDKENQPDLKREILVLQANVKQIKIHLQNVTFSTDLVFDALKSDVIRIITLGITGFDSPVAQLSIQEAVFSLEGIQKYILFLDQNNLNKNLVDKVLYLCYYLDITKFSCNYVQNFTFKQSVVNFLLYSLFFD